MHVFVTVGTTQFDSLVSAVLSDPVLDCLAGLGCSSLTLQTGACAEVRVPRLWAEEILIKTYQYKPSLCQDISDADLVISHAGAGTCIEVLQTGKTLAVIVNDSLMDNHQVELAEKLAKEGYLVYGTVSTLVGTIEKSKSTKLKPYPKPNCDIFSTFVNKVIMQS